VTYHRIRSGRQSADPGGGSSSGSGKEGSLRCPGCTGCSETDATYPQYVLESSIPGRRDTNPERTHTDDQVRDDGPFFYSARRLYSPKLVQSGVPKAGSSVNVAASTPGPERILQQCATMRVPGGETFSISTMGIKGV
jgi:hypothetical protein